MPFVARAIERVLAQDAALELLFVNVDSTDGSLQEICSISDERIRVIEAPADTAPGPARNLAARQARGDVLAFADADDLWWPDKLERQLRLRSETGAALVCSDCRVIDNGGRLLGAYLSRHRAMEGTVTNRLLEENFILLSTVLVDRAVFEYVGGFHEGFRVACDYLFSIRLSLHVTFAPDPDTLVDYRIHAGNLTSDFRRTYAENVRIFDLLLTDEAASFGVSRVAGWLCRVLETDFLLQPLAPEAPQRPSSSAPDALRSVRSLIRLALDATDKDFGAVTVARARRRLRTVDHVARTSCALLVEALVPPDEYLRWRWPGANAPMRRLRHLGRVFTRLIDDESTPSPTEDLPETG